MNKQTAKEGRALETKKRVPARSSDRIVAPSIRSITAPQLLTEQEYDRVYNMPQKVLSRSKKHQQMHER